MNRSGYLYLRKAREAWSEGVTQLWLFLILPVCVTVPCLSYQMMGLSSHLYPTHYSTQVEKGLLKNPQRKQGSHRHRAE